MKSVSDEVIPMTRMTIQSQQLTIHSFPSIIRMNNERASLTVSVKDRLVAEVRVIAPDRPGLMRDITRALTTEGFFIDSATISTKDGDTADNTFTIKLDELGGPTIDGMLTFDDAQMLQKVETLLVETAMDAWGVSYANTVQYIAPEDRVVEASATASVVESGLVKSGKCVICNVIATDRNGLLAATTNALHDIGCGIISATVATKDGIANNSFVVAAPDAVNAEKVKQACLSIASK